MSSYQSIKLIVPRTNDKQALKSSRIIIKTFVPYNIVCFVKKLNFGGHFEKRPLQRVPHIFQRLDIKIPRKHQKNILKIGYVEYTGQYDDDGYQ